MGTFLASMSLPVSFSKNCIISSSIFMSIDQIYPIDHFVARLEAKASNL